MKKIVLLLLFNFMSCHLFSQQGSNLLQGTWIGVAAPVFPEGKAYKYIIRIEKYDNFKVRVKGHPADNPSDIAYWPECHIISAEENALHWECYTYLQPDDEDRKKGICNIKTTTKCSVRYANGCIIFSQNHRTEGLNKQGNTVGNNWAEWSSKDLTLYKDNDDW